MSAPLVSICCCTYNHAPFIAQAIDGFLAQQTTFAVEIVVHDDASTDGTADIVRDYAARHPDRIIPILQPENIYSTGRRPSADVVWPRLCGRYVATCEGDDYWTDPAKLQRQVDLLEAHPEYAMCFHETLDVWEDGTSRVHTNVAEDRVFTARDLTRKNFLATATRVFRRSCIETLPDWFRTVPAGDWATNFLVALHGDLYYMKDCMAVYRQHAGGVWSSLPRDVMLLEGVKCMLALDKGSGLRFHADFTEGIRARLARGNAARLDALLTRDPALLMALAPYLGLSS